MYKETFLRKYIDIEKTVLARGLRNEKHESLLVSFSSDHSKLTTKDILNLTLELMAADVTIRQPIFSQIIYPALSKEIDDNNIEAIKCLYNLGQVLTSYQGYAKDYKYSLDNLLELGLKIAPDNRDFLEILERNTRGRLCMTIHEIPWGVLYGRDGASIEECDKLLVELNDYAVLCAKLDIDSQALIDKCKFYYTTYKDYLKTHNRYKDFKDYLTKLNNGT